jgi:hypothetical protein
VRGFVRLTRVILRPEGSYGYAPWLEEAVNLARVETAVPVERMVSGGAVRCVELNFIGGASRTYAGTLDDVLPRK